MKDLGVRKVPVGAVQLRLMALSMSLLLVTEINIVLHRLIKQLLGLEEKGMERENLVLIGL